MKEKEKVVETKEVDVNLIDAKKRSNLKKALLGGAAITAGIIGLSGVANADIILRSGGNEKSLSNIVSQGIVGAGAGTGSTIRCDNTNTAEGNYSLSFGAANCACTNCSTAVGFCNSACGASVNTAVGYYNTATGYNSSAIGSNNSACGYAFGQSNCASGPWSTAVGKSNTASGTSSSAVGYTNTACGNNSSAVGYCNTASGTSSSAVGYTNTASGTYSSAVGYRNTASGDISYSSGSGAYGARLCATGDSSVAVGTASGMYGAATKATANCAIAFGVGSCATAIGSYASGYNNTASGTCSTAVGYTNTAGTATGASAFGNNITNNVANSTEIGPSDTAKISILSTGAIQPRGRKLGLKGADVASADEITLSVGNYFDITGTTTINHIDKTAWLSGTVIILQFDASVTVTHNAGTPTGTEASILLAGAGNFSATVNDTLTLVYDGVTWRETARTVI